MAARDITRNRFTAQPWAASKEAKPASQEEMKAGWGVADICLTIPASVPGAALWPSRPCQKPRPGQAWRTAMPTKKRPMTDKIARPSRRLDHILSGRAMSSPAKL